MKKMSQESRKRKLELVSPSQNQSDSLTSEVQICWEKCMFCQTIKNEKLICPRESKNQNGENKTFEKSKKT